MIDFRMRSRFCMATALRDDGEEAVFPADWVGLTVRPALSSRPTSVLFALVSILRNATDLVWLALLAAFTTATSFLPLKVVAILVSCYLSEKRDIEYYRY